MTALTVTTVRAVTALTVVSASAVTALTVVSASAATAVTAVTAASTAVTVVLARPAREVQARPGPVAVAPAVLACLVLRVRRATAVLVQAVLVRVVRARAR